MGGARQNSAATGSQATTSRPKVTLVAAVSRTPEAAPRARAGELTLPQHDLSVHDHVLDADGRLVRILERGAIGDGLRIEHGDVGEHARTNQPALAESNALRGERSHLSHRVLERHELLFAYVTAEDPRERSVRARMRANVSERTVGSDSAVIGVH